MKKKPTFSSLMGEFQYHFDTRQVFNDFLTLTICAFGPNYGTGKSVDEDLYLSTIEKYKRDNHCQKFPELLALLIAEMEERTGSDLGNDVLGEFYEQNLYVKGKSQYFTPWPVCQFMASVSTPIEGKEMTDIDRPLRMIDPCCGSGRLIMAGARTASQRKECYGIDIDHTCVQMSAINLFLNGIFHSEVMCANALMPDDFRVSYRISFLPLGIYRITEKEKSPLWNINQNCFTKREVQTPLSEKTKNKKNDLQLKLF